MTRLLLRKGHKNFSELSIMNFALPPELEASEPPEARALARDEVHLMVSSISTNQVEHTNFRHIGDFLEPGDVLV
nr:S-adenosylmethionine:tRNA ribosyltransferase-isomerase [Chloroflexota bacterium]